MFSKLTANKISKLLFCVLVNNPYFLVTILSCQTCIYIFMIIFCQRNAQFIEEFDAFLVRRRNWAAHKKEGKGRKKVSCM